MAKKTSHFFLSNSLGNWRCHISLLWLGSYQLWLYPNYIPVIYGYIPFWKGLYTVIYWMISRQSTQPWVPQMIVPIVRATRKVARVSQQISTLVPWKVGLLSVTNSCGDWEGIGISWIIPFSIYLYLSIFIHIYSIQYIFIMGYNFTSQPAANPAHFLLTRWQSFIIETKAKLHKLCDLRNESAARLVRFFLGGSKSWDARRRLVIYQLTYQVYIILSLSYYILILLMLEGTPLFFTVLNPESRFNALLSQALRLTDFEATRFWASCRTSPLEIVGVACNGRSLAIRVFDP